MSRRQRVMGAQWGIGGRWPLRMFGVFLLVAALAGSLAAVTVLWPNTILSGVWSLKEVQYHQLLHVRRAAGAGFVALSILLASAAGGWLRHRRWAWFLAAGILSVNLVSDAIHVAVARQWASAVGVVIEGLILAWVVSRPVRGQYLR